MENQNTLLWIISIVAVVGIAAMVVVATRTSSVTNSAVPETFTTTDTSSGNIAGNAKADGCTYNSVFREYYCYYGTKWCVIKADTLETACASTAEPIIPLEQPVYV